MCGRRPAVELYQELGWSVIPVSGETKKPLVSWRKYIDRRPAIDEISRWSSFVSAGIGVVTGPVSDIVVLDADGEEGVKEAEQRGVPETPTVRTPHGGAHYYFKLPSVMRNVYRCYAKLGASQKLDVRGYGGYVVAPFTKRPDGKRYEWVKHPSTTTISYPPAWFCKLLREQSIETKTTEYIPSNETSLDAFMKKLPQHVARLIRDGHDLSMFPSRSECDFTVILNMVTAGASPSLIEEFYDNYPIGEKYREVGKAYLERTIEQAIRQQQSCIVKIQYADPVEYNESARIQLALVGEDTGKFIRCGVTIPREGAEDNRLVRALRFFAAAGEALPKTYEETRSVCKRLIGKRLRVELGGERYTSNPIAAFYAV